jgi:alkylated DNA repair dioxygenase AlkB
LHFKPARGPRLDHPTKIELVHGSLLVMKGDTQRNWVHRIPKIPQILGERINLTFRVVR